MFRNESRKETLVYVGLWLALFIAPVIGIYAHHVVHGEALTFPWDELMDIWKQFAVFFVAFIVHNYLLAPILVYRNRRGIYFSAIFVLLAVFVAIQCVSRPDMDREHGGPPPFERGEARPDRPHGSEGPGRQGFDDGREHPEAPFADDVQGPPPAPREPDALDDHRPPVILGEHDVVATIVFVLMIGMNLGVKLYFRHREDRERFALLERENLEQQLEYLKYQINPHFLMNTLNNIHALVDIDPEQAKETIVELSKIMRFVLYEGSKQTVPLRQEMIFLQNYIDLMRMRITDSVKLSVSLPEILPDRDIPPLMLITFVENAFKHGVSYRQPSFIDISVSILNTPRQSLCFLCRNSKMPHDEDQHGGVGLQNVKRRLELIYGHDYQLDIDDETDTYTVKLTLPLRSSV